MSQPVLMNGGSTTGTGVPPGAGPTGPEHVQALHGVPQGMPQAQAVLQGLPQGIPQGLPQGIPQGMPQGILPGIPQAIPQGMPQVIPQGMPQIIPQGMPQGVPQGIPQGIPPGMQQPMHILNPHAQMNGGSKTGIGMKRVPPPVRTVSLPGGGPGASGKPPLPGSSGKSPEARDSGSESRGAGPGCSGSLFLLDVLKNLGVCLLVVLYLLLGAFAFLAMNENLWDPTVIPVVSSYPGPSPGSQGANASAVGPPQSRLQTAIQESRTRTIERIWEITVNLNILYRDNWTELAGREIERFQNQLVERLAEESEGPHGAHHAQLTQHQPAQLTPLTLTQHQAYPGPGEGRRTRAAGRRLAVRQRPFHSVRWNFAQAFLFSLTVITTIGYGSVTPHTAPGKAATMVYAAVGIPLMLLYLSAVGGLLARCARGVFSRAVCCCLCSKCGYCCYDESRMADKEIRMRRRRQELEMKMSHTAAYYVRDCNSSGPGGAGGSGRGGPGSVVVGSVLSGPVLAPVLLCGSIMLCYVMGGAVALWGMRAFQFLDCVFFCFMSLTTIGFGSLVPGATLPERDADTILWFCSAYILIGMALTTMCCNVVYTVLLHAIRHATARRQQQ